MKQIDHAWRLFDTGLGFGVFGLGGLAMGILSYRIVGSENRVAGHGQLVIANNPTLSRSAAEILPTIIRCTLPTFSVLGRANLQ